VLEAHKDLRENEETLDCKERRVHKVRLDFRDLQDPWAHEENEARREALVSLDLLDWVVDLETRVPPDLLAAWDHLVHRDFLDHQAKLDPRALQASVVRGVLSDLLVLLALLV
jgi:hypothetical protein